PRRTRRSGSPNGSGRSSTPSTSEKIAVVTPMPTASMNTTVKVKPRAFPSWRSEKRRSCQNVYIRILVERCKIRPGAVTRFGQAAGEIIYFLQYLGLVRLEDIMTRILQSDHPSRRHAFLKCCCLIAFHLVPSFYVRAVGRALWTDNGFERVN